MRICLKQKETKMKNKQTANIGAFIAIGAGVGNRF